MSPTDGGDSNRYREENLRHESNVMNEKADEIKSDTSSEINNKKTILRYLGFCGVDDSVNPRLLHLMSQGYPFVEFGVLFRPDKEGEPRYASEQWVNQLTAINKDISSGSSSAPSSAAAAQATPALPKIRLAAHLCGTRVNNLLHGCDDFILQLSKKGFQRIQINATAVNGVDTTALFESSSCVASVITKYPHLEFIIQKNEETRPLWEGLLNYYFTNDDEQNVGRLPHNVTMLLDESKGTGVLSSTYSSPPDEYDVGYAGGIGPNNIADVLSKIKDVTHERKIWIDMESSLRSVKDGEDIFDLKKCEKCIDAVCAATLDGRLSFNNNEE